MCKPSTYSISVWKKTWCNRNVPKVFFHINADIHRHNAFHSYKTEQNKQNIDDKTQYI